MKQVVPILLKYLEIGKSLLEENGKYIKNVGDAHMGTFEHLEGAIRFATELQQYIHEQHCLERHSLLAKVALYLGPVVPNDGDVFGLGVNRAARAQGWTDPCRVTINRSLWKYMNTAWGTEVGKFFESIGTFKLKGVRAKERLYDFKWQLYAKDNPKESLASRIYSCLEDANTVPTNINVNNLNIPGVILASCPARTCNSYTSWPD